MILNMFESCNVTHTAMLLMRVVQDEERCKRLNFKLDQSRGQLVFLNFHASGAMETMVTNVTLFLKFGLPESGAIADLLHFFLETIENAPLCVLVRSDYALSIVMTLSSGMTWMLDGFNVMHLQSVNLPNYCDETLNDFEMCLFKRCTSVRSVKHLRQLEKGEGVWMEKECKKTSDDKMDVEFVPDEDADRIDKEMGVEVVPLFWSMIKTENKNAHLSNRLLRWRIGRLERSATVKHGWLYEMWSEVKDVARDRVEASILNSEFFADGIEEVSSKEHEFDFVTLLDILTKRDMSFVSTLRQESMTIKSLRVALIFIGALSLEKKSFFNANDKARELFETYFSAHWTRMQFFETVASRLSDVKRRECASQGFHLLTSFLNADGLEIFRTDVMSSSPRFLTPHTRFAHVYGFYMRFDCVTGKATPDGMNFVLKELETHDKIATLFGFHTTSQKNVDEECNQVMKEGKELMCKELCKESSKESSKEWKCADCKEAVVSWKIASMGDCLPCTACSKLFCPRCIFNNKETDIEPRKSEEIQLYCSTCNLKGTSKGILKKLCSV